jgi:hypothetical protein
MSDGFDEFAKGLGDLKLRLLFGMMAGAESKAEVFMAEAIEAMDEAANSLTGYDEEPIPDNLRKAAILRLCEETFDRLRRERAADLAEWKRRYRPEST